MRRTMVAVAGSITANWFAVWTATITQCEPASYWVFPASPPSSICATTVLVVASITTSRRPDSSETKKPPLRRSVRDAVREPRARYPRHDLERGIVNDHDRVG